MVFVYFRWAIKIDNGRYWIGSFTSLPIAVRMCFTVCKLIPLSCSHAGGVMMVVTAWFVVLVDYGLEFLHRAHSWGLRTAKMVRHRGWPAGFFRACLLPIRGILVSPLVFCFGRMSTEASYISRSLCRSRTNLKSGCQSLQIIGFWGHQSPSIMMAEGFMKLVMGRRRL